MEARITYSYLLVITCKLHIHTFIHYTVNDLVTTTTGRKEMYTEQCYVKQRLCSDIVPGAGKSLARPGRKQARKNFRDARDFNNIETRDVIKLFFLQGKAPKETRAFLTETLDSFLPDPAKDLSSPLYSPTEVTIR